MSTETHPWTFIDPVCGKPAFHRIGIPLESDQIAAQDHENLDGSATEPSQPFACQSCGRSFVFHTDSKPMLDKSNWVRRTDVSTPATNH